MTDTNLDNIFKKKTFNSITVPFYETVFSFIFILLKTHIHIIFSKNFFKGVFLFRACYQTIKL